MSCRQGGFSYDSILQGRRIRLLVVEPVDHQEPSSVLKVHLLNKDLDQADFDALSYVWGDQTHKEPIRCNGQNHHVGRTLHEALMEYRRRGKARHLWADAICINQGCEAEKTEQVRMMKDIYNAASRTIVWLGPPQPGDRNGISLAELSYRKFQEISYQHKEDLFKYDDFDCNALGVPEVLEGQDISPSWKAPFRLLTHPWFSRVWIIQELLVSRCPIMWRGEVDINCEAILWMATRIGGKANLRRSLSMVYDSPNFYAWNIALCRSRYQKDQPYPLWITMGSTIGMEATEIRDRYFALAGISAGIPTDFVDYSRSLEQVACQVGLMTLLGSQEFPTIDGLDYLVDLPSMRLRNQQIQIPSWIPDFISNPSMGIGLSLMYSTTKFRSQDITFPFPEFQISTQDSEGRSQTKRPPIFPYKYSKIRELQIKAVLFDKIRAVLVPVNEEPIVAKRNETHDTPIDAMKLRFEYGHRYSTKMIRFIHEARLLTEPRLTQEDEITCGNSSDAFWRTLIYNRTKDDPRQQQEPPGSVGMSFIYWYMMSKLCMTKRWEQDPNRFYLQWSVLSKLMQPFGTIFELTYGTRSFFVSESGRMGWAPSNACPGDVIGIFRGNRIPFVAKSVCNVLEYTGGCYVHGCMNNEMGSADDSRWTFQRFV